MLTASMLFTESCRSHLTNREADERCKDDKPVIAVCVCSRSSKELPWSAMRRRKACCGSESTQGPSSYRLKARLAKGNLRWRHSMRRLHRSCCVYGPLVLLILTSSCG